MADLRPTAFSKYRMVAEAQILPRPARHPRSICTPLALFPRRGGNEAIWAVTMVRNEIDIIAYTVSHLVSQGVDRVLVADNNSTDGTFDLLNDLASTMPLTVVRDREPGHYQSWKMTRLARYAACTGAQWVIPFDADEMWVAREGTLRDFLLSSELGVVKARLIDHVPHISDDVSEPNPYRRLRHRLATPELDGGPSAGQEMRTFKKVAFRAHPLARVAAGNHTVRHPGRVGEGLEIRHLPYRSPQQFRRKVVEGAAALAATDHADNIGEHWRRGVRMPDSQLARIHGGDDRLLILDPAPYTGQL
jgi:hypothetical protein